MNWNQQNQELVLVKDTVFLDSRKEKKEDFSLSSDLAQVAFEDEWNGSSKAPKIPKRSSSLAKVHQSGSSQAWNFLCSRRQLVLKQKGIRPILAGTEQPTYQCKSEVYSFPYVDERDDESLPESDPLLTTKARIKNENRIIDEKIDLDDSTDTEDEDKTRQQTEQQDIWGRILRSWIACIRFIVALRAILVRLAFFAYTFLAIVMVVKAKHQDLYYLLILTTIPLFLDLCFAVRNRIHKDNLGRGVAKWFSVCVFSFLLCGCPPIWILEIYTNDTIITCQPPILRPSLLIQEFVHPKDKNEYLTYMHVDEDDFLQAYSKVDPDLFDNMSVPESLTVQYKNAFFSTTTQSPLKDSGNDSILNLVRKLLNDMEFFSNYKRVVEQVFLLVVIVGRWLLPREGITRDQLSQLLLINVGTAADILELFEAFNEEAVVQNRMLKIFILIVWQASLLQFCFNKTAVRTHKYLRNQSCRAPKRIEPDYHPPTTLEIVNDFDEDNSDTLQYIVNRKTRKNSYYHMSKLGGRTHVQNREPIRTVGCCQSNFSWIPCVNRPFLCCETELWAIGLSLALQEIPFFILRMTLIFKYKVQSYSNIFFTIKNSLIILVQIFRVFVILTEVGKQPKKKKSQKHTSRKFENIALVARITKRMSSVRKVSLAKAQKDSHF